MSIQAKRELLASAAPRYRAARRSQKTIILDEFLAATGYDRKYAIRLLAHPPTTPVPCRRPRPRRYGPAVQEALATAWAAANYICGKRLVPFLPTLVASLERHGHLALSEEVRAQLLALSPATADRILRPWRQGDQPRGVGTTKRGTLLKHQVPIRTFADWTETSPGFVEADLVAHCGSDAAGSFLYSLVLTDVATTWTECFALRARTADEVIRQIEAARQLLPFPLRGLDTDGGSEFLNTEFITYCAREGITFTRGRVHRANDQCFVEQKNGSIVRQVVGYDRYEGEVAYRQLTEVYRAVRLYVNCFQPSLKLQAKRREGSRVRKTYDVAQTPLQRLLAIGDLPTATGEHLTRVASALDPVRLLEQLRALQDALWRHAVHRTGPGEATVISLVTGLAVRFDANGCLSAGSAMTSNDPVALRPPSTEAVATDRRRRYRRTTAPRGPRTYRTRPDPFAAVQEELHRRFMATPDRTAKQLLEDLQAAYPGQYPDGLLRTLQRRVREWRATIVLAFDDAVIAADRAVLGVPSPHLRAIDLSAGDPGEPAVTATACRSQAVG
jgi:hypothetical protein